MDFKLGTRITIRLIQLLLNQFYNIQKVATKNIFALCNFDQCMHCFKQRKDAKEPKNVLNVTKCIQVFQSNFIFCIVGVHLHNQRVILFYVLSFFALLMCIFTIKGQYYPMYTHFAKNNMEMHFVSTFSKCLFSFKFIRSISFQNSLNFLGNLCAKKTYIFCKMPFN